jgi:PAS domain S-box-containing protein
MMLRGDPAEAKPSVIGLLDEEWFLRRVSGNVESLVGYTPSECLDAGVFLSVHPDDLAELFVAMTRVTERRLSATRKLRLRNKRGGWTPVTLSVSPLEPPHPFPFAFAATPSCEPSAPSKMRRARTEVGRGCLSIADRSVFTPRQRQIVERLLAGRRVGAIARDLGVTESTVRNHLSQVFKKLGIGSQAELVELLSENQPPGSESG